MDNAAKEVKNAQEAEEDGYYGEAIMYYKQAISSYMSVVPFERDEYKKAVLWEQALLIKSKIESLKKMETEGGTPVRKGRMRTSPPPHNHQQQPTLRHNGGGGGGGGEEDMKDFIRTMCMKPEEMGNVSWDDVIGLEETKKLLKRIIELPQKVKQVFHGMRKPPRSILLYGPPGVGKTHLIKALAKHCNRAFFNISSNDLVSKYLGESGKLIKAMFSVAIESKPCILFIDEVDALCGDRNSGQQHSESSKSLNVLLEELSGMKDHNLTDVLFIGTTNLPEKIDSAMLRRFNKKIYIPLPNLNDRYALLKYATSQNKDDHGPLIRDDLLEKLARETEGYSCDGIVKLVTTACEQSLVLLEETTHFGARKLHDSQDVIIVPCSGNDTGAHPIVFDNIKPEKCDHIRLPAITYEDLVYAKRQVKPTADEERISFFEGWTKEHGQV